MNLDLTYMKMAEAMAENSKAKRKKVGAVLVTKQGVVLTGYNGTPTGTDNTCETKDGSATLHHVLHGELNCILKAAKEGVSVVESVLYVTLSPCIQCSAMLLQAGVSKVYYREQYRDMQGVEYLQENGVTVHQI